MPSSVNNLLFGQICSIGNLKHRRKDKKRKKNEPLDYELEKVSQLVCGEAQVQADKSTKLIKMI